MATPTIADDSVGREDRPSLVSPYFTRGYHPFDDVNWVTSDVRLGDFVQEDVEHPDFWSPNAVGVAAKLYLATVDGVKENSVRQMIHRVADTIADEGNKYGYFATFEEKDTFYHELCYLLVNQMMAFNTPVWLNLGVPGRKPVCSACFLLRVDDTMHGSDAKGVAPEHSITGWWSSEAKIFKGGAGSGMNASRIRGSMESLSTGGMASGPTSYIRASDAAAGTLKSGGAHRRAAKMVVLNADHPDIFDFVDMKRREDRRMRILKEAGEEINPFTASGEKAIAETTSFQNQNTAVGVTDEFMRASLDDNDATGRWELVARVDGSVVEVVRAHDLLDDIVDAEWTCGDPGVFFVDRANQWHTTPVLRGEKSPITTGNPCMETLINDDSSCNLGSFNLRRFQDADGAFKIDDFRAAVDVLVLAMDITCSFSYLPTEFIERNTRELRQLGVGYANLGAALMAQGLPYDSDVGRGWAASVTALMTGRVYRRSAEIARVMGAYDRFDENRGSHLAVIHRHLGAIPDARRDGGGIWDAADLDWHQAMAVGIDHGYRNSQATVIPPTGTTSIFMDCDSSGIEPCWAHKTIKGLAGGGTMEAELRCVEDGMRELGYVVGSYEEIEPTMTAHERSVFACANEIDYRGHVDMVCAVQPFLSGSASKTINLHESATRDDVRDAIVRAWRGGAKAVAVFRNNSKATSVLSQNDKGASAREEEAPAPLSGGERGIAAVAEGTTPRRCRLPRTRRSLNHKIHIQGAVGSYEGYVNAGTYDDGRIGEIFIEGFGRQGSFTSNALASFATSFSIAIQYGVPFDVIVRKFRGVKDETGGMVVPDSSGSPLAIRSADSIIDYIARWLVLEFGDDDLREEFGVRRLELSESVEFGTITDALDGHSLDLPTRPCSCGGIMRPSGSCYTCQSCFATTGCG